MAGDTIEMLESFGVFRPLRNVLTWPVAIAEILKGKIQVVQVFREDSISGAYPPSAQFTSFVKYSGALLPRISCRTESSIIQEAIS